MCPIGTSLRDGKCNGSPFLILFWLFPALACYAFASVPLFCCGLAMLCLDLLWSVFFCPCFVLPCLPLSLRCLILFLPFLALPCLALFSFVLFLSRLVLLYFVLFHYVLVFPPTPALPCSFLFCLVLVLSSSFLPRFAWSSCARFCFLLALCCLALPCHMRLCSAVLRCLVLCCASLCCDVLCFVVLWCPGGCFCSGGPLRANPKFSQFPRLPASAVV